LILPVQRFPHLNSAASGNFTMPGETMECSGGTDLLKPGNQFNEEAIHHIVLYRYYHILFAGLFVSAKYRQRCRFMVIVFDTCRFSIQHYHAHLPFD
jgi:hypothetical protein